MKTPDITPAQIVALTAATADLLIQFGVSITAGQQQALVGFMAVLAAIVLGDAHIRNGRAQNVGEIERVQDRAA